MLKDDCTARNIRFFFGDSIVYARYSYPLDLWDEQNLLRDVSGEDVFLQSELGNRFGLKSVQVHSFIQKLSNNIRREGIDEVLLFLTVNGGHEVIKHRVSVVLSASDVSLGNLKVVDVDNEYCERSMSINDLISEYKIFFIFSVTNKS